MLEWQWFKSKLLVKNWIVGILKCSKKSTCAGWEALVQNPFRHTCYIFDLHNFFATLQRIREGNTHIQELRTETWITGDEGKPRFWFGVARLGESCSSVTHIISVTSFDNGFRWWLSMMIFIEKNNFVAVLHFQLMCDVLDCPCQSVYGIE